MAGNAAKANEPRPSGGGSSSTTKGTSTKTGSGGTKKEQAKGIFDGAGRKMRDKVEEEVTKEAISAFRAWRQKIRNGVLPIGIAEVGKTTFLTRFGTNSPDLFFDFNRTTQTRVGHARIREGVKKNIDDQAFYKEIDVPGDFPDEWARAYFDCNPRVLVVLVDNRAPDEHIAKLQLFLAALKSGPSRWQKLKTLLTWNRGNLGGILFVVNKADCFAPGAAASALKSYRQVLADLPTVLGVPIAQKTMSLTKDEASELEVYSSVVELFARK